MRPEHEGVDLAIRPCRTVLNMMDLRYRRRAKALLGQLA